MIKGYLIQDGYLGLVDGQWMLFTTEAEYYEYLES